MDIDFWQRWVSVAGLLIGFYGVLLLTTEWPYIVVDGLAKLSGLQKAQQTKRANKIRTKYEKWVPYTSSDNKIVQEVAKGFIQACSKSSIKIQTDLHRLAQKHELKTINLIDENKILIADLVAQQCDEFGNHAVDLKENGEPVNTSRRGLIYVMVSLGFQLVGTVPVSYLFK